MGRFVLTVLMLCTLGAAVLGGSIARSSQYTNYAYGRQAPSAVAANGSGARYGTGNRGSYYGGSGDVTKPPEQAKAATTPEKKSGGSGLSAWGIIAIIVTVSLSLMGVYYFTLFYPIVCRKERKYVMELGSQ